MNIFDLKPTQENIKETFLNDIIGRSADVCSFVDLIGSIDYKAIYDRNKHGWYDMTEDPQKYEALLAGHYSDSNHFIYELLQNAEDAFEVNANGLFDPKTCSHANKVVIEYYNDRLVFYHNGKPYL